MSALKIGIVEDELIIAESILIALQKCGYNVIEPVTNYDDALLMIETERPDLVLLDINLKEEKDGVDIANAINEKFKLPFIFLTANSDGQSVNRAKQANPAAYLLKPFHQQDLYSSIEICLHNYKSRPTVFNTPPDSFFVKEKNSFIKIKFADVHYLESDHVYVVIHLAAKKIMVRTSMQEFLPQFHTAKFIRVHRSYVVNTDAIDSVNKEHLLINGKYIPIGKSFYDELKTKLGLS